MIKHVSRVAEKGEIERRMDIRKSLFSFLSFCCKISEILFYVQ